MKLKSKTLGPNIMKRKMVPLGKKIIAVSLLKLFIIFIEAANSFNFGSKVPNCKDLKIEKADLPGPG